MTKDEVFHTRKRTTQLRRLGILLYIIEERKGQGAKPKTVKTASPPLSAPHRRLRRPFPPRQGEKTALGRFLGEKIPTRGNFTLVQL